MSANPRGDLVSGFRAVANQFNDAMDNFVALRAEYIARNVNFTSADLSGSNITSPATFTADDVDQMVVDMLTIVNAVRSGGTIAVGVWGNVIKIA